MAVRVGRTSNFRLSGQAQTRASGIRWSSQPGWQAFPEISGKRYPYCRRSGLPRAQRSIGTICPPPLPVTATPTPTRRMADALPIPPLRVRSLPHRKWSHHCTYPASSGPEAHDSAADGKCGLGSQEKAKKSARGNDVASDEGGGLPTEQGDEAADLTPTPAVTRFPSVRRRSACNGVSPITRMTTIKLQVRIRTRRLVGGVWSRE